ncbi:STAS/SEC14 domain-containing protein [Marinobacter sp. R17]|uniref:STAS/SEC14 domain-containing protein n=1 Tax=Marinobacter TaxID=2742 RepID=UPI000F4C2A2C|nr:MULTISPECIES: STAS/SEC14 domain-containing protein [Marinobacter]ROT98149.1 STAS/SEC14 domain-containing protein [Marinobacter sp. R17]
MDMKRHGLAIGIDRVGDQFFLSFKAQGKLTHEDYQTITPMIDSALAAVEKPHVKALFDATELEGWELRAAWDDFNLGLKHGNQFDKIAVFGDKRWRDHLAKIAAWFISGDLKFFHTEEEAIAWLNE